MRNRVGLILILALVSGAVAAYLGFTVLREPGVTPAQASDDVVPVAVAARDMNVGYVLTPEDVRTVQWPQAAVPEGYSGSAAEIVGRGLLTPVKLNEPLLSSKLASKEAGAGLPILIEEGRRGLSIRVDDVTGVSGFLRPGTRVDVLVTLDNRNTGESEPITQVVLQNMAVLAAGHITQRTTEGEPVEVPVVTLDTTPEEAERLMLATNEGRIQLALRNTLDMDTVETPGARLSRLLRPEQVARQPVRRAVRAAPRQPASIEIYKGTQRETRAAEGR